MTDFRMSGALDWVEPSPTISLQRCQLWWLNLNLYLFVHTGAYSHSVYINGLSFPPTKDISNTPANQILSQDGLSLVGLGL